MRDKFGVLDKITGAVEALDAAQQSDDWEDVPPAVQEALTKLVPALRGLTHILTDLDNRQEHIESMIEDYDEV